MNPYLVHTDLERTDATGSCFVSVYDKYPADKTAVLLKEGYIYSEGNTLEQLCALLPLEQWDEVLSCSLGDFSVCTLIVASYDIENDPATASSLYEDAQTRVLDKLTQFHSLIFNDAKTQLVIVKKT